MAGELTPGRIDREALDRVIRRAAELQAAEMDAGEGITEEELIRLGSDVGIPARFLRQALYEESAARGDVLGRGVMAKWFGPHTVRAQRVVPGERAALELALHAWMTESEAMTPKRRLPDRTVWEREPGLFAEMRRGLGVGGKTYQLARAVDLSVALKPLEEGYCHVDMTADVSNTRQGALTGALVVAGAGVGFTAIVLAASLLALPAVALIPALVGIGVASAFPRWHRRTAARTQLALEQVLDRLERGEIRPKHRVAGPRASAFMRIASEIQKAFLPPSPPTPPSQEP